MKLASTIFSAILLAGVAGATSVVFSGSSGTRAAQAVFDVSGTNLTITLTNTSSYDVLQPNQILTALFFDISGNPSLTPISAMLASGSTVWFGPSNGGNVGGEWAYRGNLHGAPGGADYGISSAGFGLFGPSDRFPGPNLQGPNSPDGIQYGLTSAGDNLHTGNSAVTGRNALIHNAVVFTLGLPSGGGTYEIGNVWAQYGTCLNEPALPLTRQGPGPVIPEPASWLLLASGLPMLAALRKRILGREA